LYNQLPDDIKNLESINIFKNKLKNFLTQH
jgi:hypothetical protein